ncbi:hypothetical protein AMS58_08920 [Pseudoalteromonas porphyrae]|uniref:Uncharacterized protein n=1 Tax=Pseudoalteromonas porphyrae TaxID=187330 RepID=A0A0N1EPD8_9GAMM|nr:hypothetical protein ADS77_03795 [Pseudoalteromonas porphyrae]KPH95034.1 hypothetical protein AMS58_08920 [Pseudoalteromonas porphyrae]
MILNALYFYGAIFCKSELILYKSYMVNLKYIPKPPQDAVSVGIKSDLDKALIANNGCSLVKIIPLLK